MDAQKMFFEIGGVSFDVEVFPDTNMEELVSGLIMNGVLNPKDLEPNPDKPDELRVLMFANQKTGQKTVYYPKKDGYKTIAEMGLVPNYKYFIVPDGIVA
ncbi:MAG: hypothetical protein K5895_02105 [Lachnospiraceae bacterium]|nr:hypothetical protein [Lachnospiraceae bacterium]